VVRDADPEYHVLRCLNINGHLVTPELAGLVGLADEVRVTSIPALWQSEDERMLEELNAKELEQVLDDFITREVDELSMSTFFEAWEILDRERRATMPVIVVQGEVSEHDEVTLSLPEPALAPVVVSGNELIVNNYRIIFKLKPTPAS
jgi:hypothetical protein